MATVDVTETEATSYPLLLYAYQRMNSPWSSALLEAINKGSQWEGSLYFPKSNENLLQAWHEAFSQAPSNVCVQTSDGSPVQTSGKGSQHH